MALQPPACGGGGPELASGSCAAAESLWWLWEVQLGWAPEAASIPSEAASSFGGLQAAAAEAACGRHGRGLRAGEGVQLVLTGENALMSGTYQASVRVFLQSH